MNPRRLATALMFLSTLALLTPVKEALTNVRYSQPAPSVEATLSTEPSDPKLFDQVNFHSSKNFAQALRDMRVIRDRVAIIVPLGDDYENELAGTVMKSTRTTEFMIMIADKDFSIDSSQLGSTRQSPGILAIKDLTVQLLVQKPFQIGARTVVIQPAAGAIVALEWEEEKNAPTVGRECWNQGFRAYAGFTSTPFGRRT
jgi:hypothetical protein